MMDKNFNFGWAVGFSIVLTVLLVYSVFWIQGQRVENEQADETEVAAPVYAPIKAEARFVNMYGEQIGEAFLQESPNGVLIMLALENLPPGEHAIHIHEAGVCTPVNIPGAEEPQSWFSNAGDHLNPLDKAHGLLNPDGPHAGDLPNIFVGEDGTLETHLFSDRVTLSEETDGLAYLLDDDGSALVIHEGADDYKTPPTGNTGDRIACAVIRGDEEITL